MRQVIEQQRAQIALDALAPSHNRIKEIFDALVWRISRRPQDGVRLTPADTPLLPLESAPAYVVHSDDFTHIPGLPCLTLVYRANNTHILIEDLRIS